MICCGCRRCFRCYGSVCCTSPIVPTSLDYNATPVHCRLWRNSNRCNFRLNPWWLSPWRVFEIAVGALTSTLYCIKLTILDLLLLSLFILMMVHGNSLSCNIPLFICGIEIVLMHESVRILDFFKFRIILGIWVMNTSRVLLCLMLRRRRVLRI